jgi:hypothetical protein
MNLIALNAQIPVTLLWTPCTPLKTGMLREALFH